MTTLVVDGNNLLIRAVKATERVPLSSEDGVPTAAIHAFIQSIARYIRQEQPGWMVVCWDGGRSTHRLAIDAHYKEQRHARSKEDEHGDSPFGQAKEFLTLANIHHVEMPGVEGDDLVAAYWRIKRSDERIVILSGDKDFLQLIDSQTTQVRPGGRTGDARWTEQRVIAELGCRPDQLPLVMALTGDALDNVPGVPGFGHKTACKWLARYDWSLEALLQAGEPRLDGYRDQILRALALVDLRSPVADIDPPPVPAFTPTMPSSVMCPDLCRFLDRYQLVSVRDRLMTNLLWSDIVTPVG